MCWYDESLEDNGSQFFPTWEKVYPDTAFRASDSIFGDGLVVSLIFFLIPLLSRRRGILQLRYLKFIFPLCNVLSKRYKCLPFTLSDSINKGFLFQSQTISHNTPWDITEQKEDCLNLCSSPFTQRMFPLEPKRTMPYLLSIQEITSSLYHRLGFPPNDQWAIDIKPTIIYQHSQGKKVI
jgi:hypothetical protein